MHIRDAAKRILPASIVDLTRRLAGRPSHATEAQGEKGRDFYDRTFDVDDHWKKHYTEIREYVCWTVIIDRLRNAAARRVLEIGCGSGQLAAALRDAGVLESYYGFDFSARRLAQARLACPEFSFEIADAFKTDLYDRYDYDSALSTEFLEHVERDLWVLSRLREGTRFIGTVPNFPFVSHVRHFTSNDEVAARYGPLFDPFSVTTVPLTSKGKVYYLIEGVRNARSGS
jgi:SAM-dependent methyltransferase